MFLVRDAKYWLFFWTDPKDEGYQGTVDEGVFLHYDQDFVHTWPYDGTPRPSACIGRDPTNPKSYRVFRSEDEMKVAGYQFEDWNTPFIYQSWSAYEEDAAKTRRRETGD